MTSLISELFLSRLSKLIAEQTGLFFPRDRWRDIERGVVSAAGESGSQDPESFVRNILSSVPKKEQIEFLASFLTVGESYFFREKKSFEVLERCILPERILALRGRERQLRIWSAGCATGEEPYSLAILITRMIPDFKDWDISILATDINPPFLQKARQGVYSEWSFRDVPQGIKETYFRKTGEDRRRILPHFKKMIRFSRHNLAEDNYPSVSNNTAGMDLIFCRNVIMYLAEENRKKVINHFYNCLVDGGLLVVSPSEISHVLFSQFVAPDFPDAPIYRKDGGKTRTATESAGEEIPAPPLFEDVPLPDGKGASPMEFGLSENTATAGSEAFEEALSLFGLGRYAEAEARILNLLSLIPQDPKAIKLFSKIKANKGDLSEALQWSEKLIAADKLDPENHYLCATILQEMGRVEEAVLSLKRSLYLDPDFMPAHFALGSLFRRQGKQKESRQHFRNALALLKNRGKDEPVAEADGISAGRLIEIIRSVISEEIRA